MYLTQSLKRAAQTNAAATAVIFQGRSRTWSELEKRVAKLAGALQQLGLHASDRVAILMLNSDRYLELSFATFWAGGVVVPMNIRWTPAEHIYSLDDSGATILVVDDAFQALVPGLLSGASGLKTVLFAGEGVTPPDALSYETVLDQADAVADALRGDDDLAGIYYTGGTTGFPKGVMLSHKALWSNAMTTMHEIDIRDESVYLHAAPMFHLADGAASNAVSLAGAMHVVIPAFHPEKWLAAVASNRVSHCMLVPTMIKLLLDQPVLDQVDLSSLRCIVYGASPISETTLRVAIAKLPHCQFIQAYGQTELAPVATVLASAYHVLEEPKAALPAFPGRGVISACTASCQGCEEYRAADHTGFFA